MKIKKKGLASFFSIIHGCCSHSAILSLEHALLNKGTICSEMIIDVSVLRCISVLTGCGHAGVHLPPPEGNNQPRPPAVQLSQSILIILLMEAE